MGARTTLINNLKTIIGEVDGIQEVSKYPQLNPNGYPYVLIAESEAPGDYESSQDHIRVYAFKVWIMNEYDQETFTGAIDLQRNLADSITDKIDEQESPNSSRELGTGLASKYTLVGVKATNGRTINDAVEKVLATELLVRCMILVDLTALS